MIQARKINWSSFGNVYDVASVAKSVTGTALQSVLSVTVPESGVYLILASGGAYSLDYDSLIISLGKNGTEDTSTRELVMYADASNRLSLAISNVFTLTASNVVNLMIASNSAGKNATIRSGFTLAAIRIA